MHFSTLLSSHSHLRALPLRLQRIMSASQRSPSNMARVALYVVAAALALSGMYLALTAGPPDTADRPADTVVPPPSTMNRRPRNATLFCYAVATTADAPLFKAHHDVRSGIFGCDEWAIFTNASVHPGVHDSRRVIRLFDGSMEMPIGGDFKSSLNAPLLHRVWAHLTTSRIRR